MRALELGAVGDAAGREVRHHREALVGEAAGGREHLGEFGAVDVREVDAGAGGQDGAEVLDLGGGARHHLDGQIRPASAASAAPEGARARRAWRTKDRIFAIGVSV